MYTPCPPLFPHPSHSPIQKRPRALLLRAPPAPHAVARRVEPGRPGKLPGVLQAERRLPERVLGEVGRLLLLGCVVG